MVRRICTSARPPKYELMIAPIVTGSKSVLDLAPGPDAHFLQIGLAKAGLGKNALRRRQAQSVSPVAAQEFLVTLARRLGVIDLLISTES